MDVSTPHHSNRSLLMVRLSCSLTAAGQWFIRLLTISARWGAQWPSELVCAGPLCSLPVNPHLPDPVSPRLSLRPLYADRKRQNVMEAREDGSRAQRSSLGVPRHAGVSYLRVPRRPCQPSMCLRLSSACASRPRAECGMTLKARLSTLGESPDGRPFARARPLICSAGVSAAGSGRDRFEPPTASTSDI
jgi:hypothetical protein